MCAGLDARGATIIIGSTFPRVSSLDFFKDFLLIHRNRVVRILSSNHISKRTYKNPQACHFGPFITPQPLFQIEYSYLVTYMNLLQVEFLFYSRFLLWELGFESMPTRSRGHLPGNCALLVNGIDRVCASQKYCS
jgi:hypothetical protein